MRLVLLILFIAVPLAEIALLIEIGGRIGVGATIGLVVLTAVVGVLIIRRQGVAALRRARASLEADQLPVEPVIDGICLLVAGAFLLTPGLITDTVGFLLLVPALRRALAWRAFARMAAAGHVSATILRRRGRGGPDDAGAGRGPVIEGEFTPVEEDPPRRPRPGSGQTGGRDRPSPWRG